MIESIHNSTHSEDAARPQDVKSRLESQRHIFVSVGNHTRRLLWNHGSLEHLCYLIVELFNARDASSFFCGLRLDMGLFLIEPFFGEHSVYEQVVNPEEQLRDGCVVEVRNKLWRAVLKYSVVFTDTESTHENERMHALKKYVYRIMMEPDSSRLASWVATARNLSSILSSFNAVYMTLPDYRMKLSGSLIWMGPMGSHAIEAACSLWFTMEVILQIFSIPSLSMLLRRTTAAVNVLSVVPWYSRLVGIPDVGIFAMFRLLQMNRALATIPNSAPLIKLMAKTFSRAAHMLALLSCLISMLIGMLAVVLWTVERGEWDGDSRIFLRRAGWSCPVSCHGPATFGAYSGCSVAGETVWMTSRDKIGSQQHLCSPVQEESPFSSLLSCAWFCTVAVVTVGYGDMIPVTNLGRCITVAAMLMGVIVIALPITVVGSTFSATYTEMKDTAGNVSGRLPEAALFVSAVSQHSQCHAQQGCHGLERPLRIRDRIAVSNDGVPVFGSQTSCAARKMEAVGTSHQPVRTSRTSFADFQVGNKRPSVSSDLLSAKALLEPDAEDASSDDEDSEDVIEQRYRHRRALIEGFLDLGMISQDSTNTII